MNCVDEGGRLYYNCFVKCTPVAEGQAMVIEHLDESYRAKIRNYLIHRAYAVRVDAKLNLLNLAGLSEDFYAEFLNILLDLQLENANATERNKAGIDLIDWNNQVAVQVSATCAPDTIRKKIRNSIEKFKIPEGGPWQFYFVPITDQSPDLKSGFDLPDGLIFDESKDVLDITRIMELAKGIEKLQKLSELVDKYSNQNKENKLIGIAKRICRFFTKGTGKNALLIILLCGIVGGFLLVSILGLSHLDESPSQLVTNSTSSLSTDQLNKNESTSPNTTVQISANDLSSSTEEEETITQYRYGAWYGSKGTWCCKWDLVENPHHADYTITWTEWSTTRYYPEKYANGEIIKILCGYGYSDENHPHQFFAGTLDKNGVGTVGKNNLLKDYWYKYIIDGQEYYWEEERVVPASESRQ